MNTVEIIVEYKDQLNPFKPFTKTFEENLPTEKEILEGLFVEWTSASSWSSEEFNNSGTRTMTVGDIVSLRVNEGKWARWRCEDVGWSSVNIPAEWNNDDYARYRIAKGPVPTANWLPRVGLTHV